MFLADYPAELPWLQLVAFVPLFVGCLRAPSWRRAALLGGLWGLARSLPLGIMLEGLGVPLLPAVALGGYLLALDAVLGVLVHAMRRWPAAAVAVGTGVTFAVLELVDATLPMWGTARSLARSWVIVPELVGGLLQVGGPPLLALVIVAGQASVAVAITRKQGRALATGLLAIAVLLGSRAFVVGPPHEGELRVGAIGWPQRGGELDAELLVAEAAAAGAKLVVLPEAAFDVGLGQRARFDARWGAVARRHRVHLVVGYIDREASGNRLAVFGPDGEEVGRYTKTHLIPLSERFVPGDGERLVFEVDGARVGALICQDDNFRDLVGAYVEEGVDILVVPTNEGPPAVAPYHYRNARLRTIERRVTLVRAAARGTSAVVAAGGRVVAELDHPTEGARAVVASAPY